MKRGRDAHRVLERLEIAPRNLLLVLDRSVEMASNFEGSPRWQLATQALMHTQRRANLTLGALLYPSSARADCTDPTVCACSNRRCTVNPMAVADQLAFQPRCRRSARCWVAAHLHARMSAGVRR
jgi:hypothetical protein